MQLGCRCCRWLIWGAGSGTGRITTPVEVAGGTIWVGGNGPACLPCLIMLTHCACLFHCLVRKLSVVICNSPLMLSVDMIEIGRGDFEPINQHNLNMARTHMTYWCICKAVMLLGNDFTKVRSCKQQPPPRRSSPSLHRGHCAHQELKRSFHPSCPHGRCRMKLWQ